MALAKQIFLQLLKPGLLLQVSVLSEAQHLIKGASCPLGGSPRSTNNSFRKTASFEQFPTFGSQPFSPAKRQGLRHHLALDLSPARHSGVVLQAGSEQEHFSNIFHFYKL